MTFTILKLYLNKNVKSLLTEIKKVKELSAHKQLIPIQDYFLHPQKEKIYFIREEFSEGSLNDFVCRRSIQETRQPYEKLLLISDIVNGLDFVHKNELIHGDPSPYNIQVVKENSHFRCKLCITSCLGLVPNSAIYSAPEILESYSPSKSSDVFTLGLTFLALWTEYGAENGYLLPFVHVEDRWKSVVWMLRNEEDINSVLNDMFPSDKDLIRLLRGMLCWKPSERSSTDVICKKINKARNLHIKVKL